MRVTTIAAVAVTTLFLIGTVAGAAEVPKIAVVDFQNILENSNAGKAAQEIIKKEETRMESDLKKRGKEIEEIQKKLEAEFNILSQEKRTEKERDFRIKYNDFKSIQKDYQRKLQELQGKQLIRMQKEVLGVAKEIGKQKGYTLIIEKREAGILFAQDAIDITSMVIDYYNKAFAKKQKAGGGSN